LVDKILGLHKTLLKSDREQFAAFLKDFCEILGNVATNRREGIAVQIRMVYLLTIFKSILQIKKAFGVN
jgi:hypothetical protein